jgi:hypothetical protein
MASACSLTYPLLVEPPKLAHGGGCRALVSGSAPSASDGHPPEVLVAKDQVAAEAGHAAANNPGGSGHAIPGPARRLVLDAAQ